MKCKGCNKRPKAEICAQCKRDVEEKFNHFVDDIKMVAEGSTNTRMILKKINEVLSDDNM